MRQKLNTVLKQQLALLTLVGFSFHLLTVTLTHWVGSIGFFVDSDTTTTIAFQVFSSTSFILVLLLTACIAYRFSAPLSKRLQSALLVAPSLAILLGILLVLFESFQYSLVAIMCSAVFLGIGCAGNFMVYQRTFFSFITMKPSTMAIIVIGGTALAALLYYLVSWLPSLIVVILFALVFIPGTCAVPLACRRLGEWNPSNPLREEKSEKPHLKKALSSLLMPCISIAFLAFLWKLLRTIAVDSGDIILINNLGSFGRLLSAVLLLALLLVSNYQIRMSIFYRWALPVVGTAMLLLPFLGVLYSEFIIVLIYCLFSVASMIAILAFNQVSFFYGISPLVTFGFGYGSFHLVGDLGTSLFMNIFGDVFFPITFQTKLVFTLAALYAIFLLFVLSNRFEQKSKTHAWSSEELSMIDTVSTKRKKACKELSEQFGLTAKESEVLEYLALGYRASNIALLMTISENTVNFHLKNIYRKLSVHNKHDLFLLLDGNYALKST